MLWRVVGSRHKIRLPKGCNWLKLEWIWFPLGQKDPLEEGMETHSSILAWRISWTEQPGGLQSIGLHRVGHEWSDLGPLLYPPCYSVYLTFLTINNILNVKSYLELGISQHRRKSQFHIFLRSRYKSWYILQ